MSIEYNDRTERVIFGAAIIGGNILAGAALALITLPEGNAQLLAQVVGGLNASLGIIVAATWKTSSVERSQAQTVQTLASAASAPLTTSTTTTTDRTGAEQGNTPKGAVK